ncbi:olfactory receptor 5V1-like [Gopherus evgoodei]|uniref:olfactory receptor 5V1-like n=1 Tax=Gopherus evgoodei TaxID=1825980 RepID=UPI0011CF1F36|nr:olfactory receptor 5V1-like [Gopherus evgoodei]
MENQTTVTEFILLGLSNDSHLQIPLFLVFLVIYLITQVGNILIMLVIKVVPQLHTPMYFFLSNLSFLDVCYSSVSILKMLENFLAEQKTISLSGCIAQIFFFIFMVGTEIFLLSVMAYDRYAAFKIQHHYEPPSLCEDGVGCIDIWFPGFLGQHPLLYQIPCEINHFSCEFPLLLQLSCTDTFANEMVILCFSMTLGFASLLLILTSYICILSTILRIRSSEGRRRAFSTYASHITIVLLFCGTAFIRYMRPASGYTFALDKLVSVQYSILTPMLNPIIYSLKNKDVKLALRKLLGR